MVYDEPDERDNNPKLKVLYLEDIDLWILRDPERNGGRDRLEKLPVLYPITHILTRALAEGVIANEGYQTNVDSFFAIKLNKRALKIRWKKETAQDSYGATRTATIFNYMGLRLDENAPKRVPDEMMRMIGPNAAVRRLEQKLEALHTALRQKYGRPSWATEDEIQQYETTQAQLSAARQKQPRKVFRKLAFASHSTEPARHVAPNHRRSYTRKKPEPCIFCGKVYTRIDALWDHLEDHFERAKGEPLVCPREECNGIVLDAQSVSKPMLPASIDAASECGLNL
ncbi:hypothetical protein B0T26DRAFT_772136 [Lasiosphaeria miniovina]|uniref:C2H2-type domain-containing protein n=1 Tax=Lasiosphaeria miniovina TaxID=1954250 RepID=A0AA40AVS8_9PEZI|nr:uncharacterized protein B0T26DRAFT_772136 [Lasiosphaeria miniovina]KAK0722950.1 hypothetical protein B0T26DRAFT_772136 [Lasiosphaeria miniovina]